MHAARAVAPFAALLVISCAGRPAAGNPTGRISGLVVKGAVQAATVTAYPIDAGMNRGSPLANVATNPDGTFTLTIPQYDGPLELVAFGGVYSDEAVAVPVQLTHEFTYVVPGYRSGSSLDVTISPMSSIVRALAKAAIRRGAALANAVSTAWTHVDSHFGGIDWSTIRPTSLTPSSPTTVTMSDATIAALILAGLSQEARGLAEQSGLSPATSVTGGTLAGAAADDATDGTLDGMAGTTPLSQGAFALGGHTFRRGLGQAIVQWVGTQYNKTQLAAADVIPLATALAADSDPYLFCANQTAAASCAGGPLQLQPPTIAFLDPPTFVNGTSVTLRVKTTDLLAPVTAVYAQPVSGSAILGSSAGGTWTIPNVPLASGPNLLYVWAVDAAGTGSIANAAQITVTSDTHVPAPYVNTAVGSYYDERTVTLASAAVPPVYQFPVGTTKVSAVLGPGIWKAATRLGWQTPPTPALLEGTNPDNIPFVQIAVPISATWSPTVAGSISIQIGPDVVTTDAMPWRSPSSTNSTEFYDVPLASNLAPDLATTTTSPITIVVSVTVTDGAGVSGSVTTALPPLHVVGAPIFIAEDPAYPTFADSKSTFAYSIGVGGSSAAAYSALWNPNPAASPFFHGQVRLVRYVLSNPAPVAIAVAASFIQDPGGSWRAVEQWTPFNGGVVSAVPCVMSATGCGVVFAADGFGFNDYWEVFTGSSSPPCPRQVASPCGGPNATTHWLGATATQFSCTPVSYWTSPVPDGFASFSSSDVSVELFQGPLLQGGEVLSTPTASNGMAVVPAASGTVPGTAVLYLARPVNATRTRGLNWNGVQYQATVGYFWAYETSHGFPMRGGFSCTYDDYRAHIGGAALTGARDEVHGTLNVSTTGITSLSTAIGEVQPQFVFTIAGPIGTH